MAELPPLSSQAYDVGETPDSLDRLRVDFGALGDMFRVYSPSRRSETWIVSDPREARQVLAGSPHHCTKGVGVDRIKLLLGEGLMTSEGEVWQRERRLLQPLFARAAIDALGPMIGSVVQERIQDGWLKDARSEHQVDVSRETKASVLEISLRALFGNALTALVTHCGEDPFAWLSDANARDLEFARRFRSLSKHAEAMVDFRRRDGIRDVGSDWLGKFLSSPQGQGLGAISKEELASQLLTLLVAGYETTSSVLDTTWYLLARHPDIAATIQKEVSQMPVEAGDWTLAKTESLGYTGQVLMEVMRLYPPGWLLTRRSSRDSALGQSQCPAGADVFVSPYLIHRHPEHWADPESFRPSRFADNSASRADAYLPFGVGARRCIGDTFAMYVMKIHIAMVLRQIDLRLPEMFESPVYDAEINLRMRTGLRLLVARRTANGPKAEHND